MDEFGPLFHAVEMGDLESVQAALAQGADPNAEDQRGLRLLHIAAAAGQADAVNLLVASGADVNGRDRWQATALWWSAAKGQGEIIDLLIALGADVNAVNDRGVSPLFAALSEGHSEAVNLLLAMGADPRTPEYDGGRTPLHVAAARGDVAACSLLIAAGADPKARDLSGATAADLAHAAGYGAVVQMLGVDALSPGGPAAAPSPVPGWSEPPSAGAGPGGLAGIDREEPPRDKGRPALESLDFGGGAASGPPAYAPEEEAAAAPEPLRLTVQGLPDALAPAAQAPAAQAPPEVPAEAPAEAPPAEDESPASPKPAMQFRYAPSAAEAEGGIAPEMPVYGPGPGEEAEAGFGREPARARPQPEEEEILPVRRRRRKSLPLGVLAVLVLAAVGFGLLRYRAELRHRERAAATPAATPLPTLPPIPPVAALVTDRAGILSASSVEYLEKELRQVRERMSIEVLVVTVASVEPRSVESYAADVAAQRAASGVRPTVLLTVVKDHVWFVLPGSDLETVLTEQRIADIRGRVVKGHLERQDLGGGTRAATTELVGVLEANYQVVSATKRAEEMATIRELNLTSERVYATPTDSRRPLKSTIVTHPNGAAVIIDRGAIRGFSPLTVELSPGTHSVHIWWQGRLPRAEKIVVTQEGATYSFRRDSAGD